jgi:hypothetical protein
MRYSLLFPTLFLLTLLVGWMARRYRLRHQELEVPIQHEMKLPPESSDE